MNELSNIILVTRRRIYINRRGGFYHYIVTLVHKPKISSTYYLLSIFLFFSGVVNRGDSFRRRRSRSNSLAPPGVLSQESSPLPTVPATPQEVTSYRVAMVGAQGVGKTALISQFMTSECINAYDRSHCKYFIKRGFLKRERWKSEAEVGKIKINIYEKRSFITVK